MKKGRILRKIAMLMSLVMLITSTIGTTYGYIVMKTDPVTNVFVPGSASVGGLTISKTVEHPFGASYAIPENIRFDFSVQLGSYYAKAKLNTTLGEMTADANGVLTVSLKPGTEFAIEGLEKGTTIKVTEEASTLSGFAIKGDATQTLTVGADGSASIRFVNTYTPAAVKPGNVTVSGIKVLEGRDWQDGDTFAFTLEQKTGESWTKLGEKTVSYDAANADFNKFQFTEIFQALTFDKVGTYEFRMSEVAGDLENVDYDTTVNHFTVKVTDVDMDGKLELSTVSGTENAAVTQENGTYAVSVTFNNTFVPPVVVDPDPVTVQISIEKIVKNLGSAKHGRDGFQFVLKNSITHEAMVATSAANGTASLSLTFEKADVGNVYTYTLYESNQGVKGMTYDADVHELAIAVSLDENNALALALKMDGQDVDTLQATFENTYNAKKPGTPSTGDRNRLNFWFILMVVSASALIAVLVYDRKSRKA